jgi:hypothetical protein
MLIIGAGHAGLIAANILRRHNPRIIEGQKSLPENHSAILRFRTSSVSDATGIPFKSARVHKAILDDGVCRNSASITLSNSYSQKVTGKILNRSVLDLQTVDRFIAPDNFTKLLSNPLTIEFGKMASAVDLARNDEPIIWTGPMPTLMDMIGWERIPKFEFKEIYTCTWEIEAPEIEVYQTIYYPSDLDPAYRASLLGNRLIVEYIRQGQFSPVMILRDFGISNAKFGDGVFKRQKYGKILPIDDDVRKEFIMEMTDRWGIYCLGRFATWRQILLDDIVGDVNKIDGWITHKDRYNRKGNWG